ncbi:polymerase delta-interacting protein 3 isoform X2 [Amia ocellicauda]|uniref:polymerase delta-interacting protein 3 isoform X2 n=1 Tax=Amia ocellicauda TaxID=2972642 RepID=UPI003463DADE
MADLSLDDVIRLRGFNSKANTRPVGRGGGGGGGLRSRIGAPPSAPVAPVLFRGGVGAFDARQKIGVSDARQRLGGGGGGVFPVKDAREKLTQKDARFRIRGGSGAAPGAGAPAVVVPVSDARQAINSRKQQQQVHNNNNHHHSVQLHNTAPQLQPHSPQSAQFNPHPLLAGLSHSVPLFLPVAQRGLLSRVGQGAPDQGGGPRKLMDARDRLSLKRSIAGGTTTPGAATPSMKITKTIQRPVGLSSGVRINVMNRAPAGQTGDEDDGMSLIPSKQMKITTTNDFAQPRAHTVSGSCFSLGGPPFTKVVQNDAYTAPPPPAPAQAPPPAPAAPPQRPPALQPVSRTLINNAPPTPAVTAPPAAPQPVFSPLEGTKLTVNNLHPRVTEEDIVELFCVCGALKRARLLRSGVAEVVFVRKDDAVAAYRKYNNRCLDGQPMKCNLHIQGNVITSDQPILLRLSDSPGSRQDSGPSALRRSAPRPTPSQPPPEVDPQTVLRALFKSPPGPPADPAAPPTAFRIKI